MDEMLDGSYNFIAKHTSLDLIKLTDFINQVSIELENEHRKSGLFTGVANNGYPKLYNPIDFFLHYNIFLYQNNELYDFMQIIKSMTIEMCDRLSLNFDEQKYHVHGWINRYVGELKYTDKKDLPWHNHGPANDEFHGLLSVDSEPSITHYKIDGEDMDLQQINGRCVLLTNYEHSHGGDWNSEKPRITLAFNVKPIKGLPDRSFGWAPYIPL